MESKRDPMRSFGNSKIIKIAAYKRKKLIQRNKVWIIMIGMIAAMASTAIYFREEITHYIGDQIIYQNPNIMMPL